MTMDTGHVFEAPPASQAPVRRASVAKSAAAWLRGFSRAAFSTSLASSTSRMRIVALAFLGLYGVIGGRLIYLGFKPDPANLRRAAAEAVATARPDILDRNGEILATDVKTCRSSPSRAGSSTSTRRPSFSPPTLPDLDAAELRERLGSKKGFVWLKREITPEQQREVFHLGLPGIGFLTENKRVYPNGPDRRACARPRQYRQPGHRRH